MEALSSMYDEQDRLPKTWFQKFKAGQQVPQDRVAAGERSVMKHFPDM